MRTVLIVSALAALMPLLSPDDECRRFHLNSSALYPGNPMFRRM